MESGAASEFIGSSCAAAAAVILLDNGDNGKSSKPGAEYPLPVCCFV